MPHTTSVALSILLTCFLQVCICRLNVSTSEGDSVVLPCIYTHKDPQLPQNPTVIWKDPEDQTLLTLEGGVEKSPNQGVHICQKNLVGNFSIQITNVTLKASGVYECHIPSVDFQNNVYLTVKERKGEDPNMSHKSSAVVFVLSTYGLMWVIVHVFV